VPRLLAFDTATDRCSVALLQGDVVVEASELVGQRHSERVLPMAQALLAEQGVELRSLDAVAFGAGPGSFTGLRIACGIAQGLAYGLDLPVVPVVNPAAAALCASGMQPAARRVAVAVDARMNEVYWGVYGVGGADGVEVTEIVGPSLSSAADLPSLLAPHRPDTLAGDAQTVFAAVLASVPAVYRLPAARASAGTIARLAAPMLARGAAVPPAQAMPVYVRDRVALTIDERRAAAAEKVA
jgi:tRNA threonylcarbamoyladenosine biosynthesis protein TsaB